ncbi:hypothetical protein EBR96_05835 [bacterium]|nr:hypothetical protein [bacterium]
MKPNFRSTLDKDDLSYQRFQETGDLDDLTPELRFAYLEAKIWQEPLSPQDLAFLTSKLHDPADLIAVRAVSTLSGLDKPELQIVLDEYPKMSWDRQKLLLPFIAASGHSTAMIFLFVYILVPDASDVLKRRMKALLQMLGVDYARPFISAAPMLPDPDFFADVYGKDFIQSMQVQ